MILFLFLLFSTSPLFSMVADGIHEEKSYVDLANEAPALANATVFVTADCADGQRQQTGVLITPTLVLTAAHGVIQAWKNGTTTSTSEIRKVTALSIYFSNGDFKKGTAVALNAKYLENRLGSEDKYDLALIRLDSPADDRIPISLLPIWKREVDDVFRVVTFGNADRSSKQPILRAFNLFESDRFFPNPYDDETLSWSRSVLLSSLFFKPFEKESLDEEEDGEIEQRSFEATRNWKKGNKRPYALALPGTSGAPVFLFRKGAWHVVGIVTAFSSLPGEDGILETDVMLNRSFFMPKKDVRNRFQTIFALPSIEDQAEGAKLYRLDPLYIQLIQRLEGLSCDVLSRCKG